MLRSLRLGLSLAALALVPALALAQGSGINRGFLDPTCSPCKDFYRYANGAWMDTANVPAAYNSIGTGREMADRNQETLHRVLERVAANSAKEKDASLRKVGVLYAVLMDSARADREGAAPLQPYLARIDAIRSKEDYRKTVAYFQSMGGGGPFRIQTEADPKQSTMNIANLWQGGLGLPERDYYFRTDPKSDTLRRDYVAFMTKILTLSGVPSERAASEADAVMKLETALAESALTRVQMRDPHALYNKMTLQELGAMTPSFDWVAFFGDLGLPAIASPTATVDVSMPKFMKRMGELLDTVPLETWKAHLKWQVVRFMAPWMSRDFFDANFAFQSRLTGTKVPLPRWKRAAAAVDGAMGEALGKAFVETEFPPASKAKMVELVDNLQATYRERIAKLDWMSAETKKQAAVKLDAILKKIGYPDKWRDYSALEIDPALSAAENLRRAQAFEQQRQLKQIGKPVDRTEWGMSPPTVNAYYNPSINEIVFPAGILQRPYFDPKADDAVNYGSIGMVIGHEITHGFDDEGRQYDAVGNLKDWWTDADAKAFQERADRVVRQYDGYIGVDTLHVNGKLTLGENIADLGGLTIAYYAYQRSLKGKPAPVIDGLTGEQRFFLGHAQGWRRKLRPETTRLQVLSDPHSPAVWRVNGPASNMQEFQRAFGCKEGDAMVRPADVRAVIW